ncbi:glycerol acyltransferase [Maribacter algarum]|uniref:Glycerol acyltransferase n=1 Tax=Maribacter algarum (ex Zhang et al. 2020) TaxID=2578118 RepID=A0A5S3PGH3_9FLAO|nr:lysophospholipid acyltransferase family protein [Maribacter algarum]TMM53216.1 glycerol acyltransferase [Maribacter algarum]
MKANLHLYYGKIRVSGLENVPKDKPVLFLPNHQSALLDVLLIATDCNRKPWFLTRSDVFKSKTLISIFNFFQMIPIYRIRDGRESLKNNQAVFDRCSELLIQKEALLMFPEANHNLKRRVRPLSKGFTRILFNTLDKAPETDIMIIPVGINYRDAIRFPDKVALYFDTPIAVNGMYDPTNEKGSVDKIKKAVSSRLKTLTTHIENEETYDETVQKLEIEGVDFLNPKEVNAALQNLNSTDQTVKKSSDVLAGIGKGIFTLLNLPMLILWRTFGKPKVWEPEFMGTLRFAFALLTYPIYYGLVLVIVATIWNPLAGLIASLSLFVINWSYTKWGSA